MPQTKNPAEAATSDRAVTFAGLSNPKITVTPSENQHIARWLSRRYAISLAVASIIAFEMGGGHG